jgi:small ligand-binding sensory domain FIST
MGASKAFFSALSTQQDWRAAVQEAAAKVSAGLGGGCDLVLLFITELYPGLDASLLPALIGEMLPYKALIGCNSSGVIGGMREVEMEPAVTIMGMRLPEVKLTPFYLSPADLSGLDDGQGLLRRLDIYPTDLPKFLAFADPMSCDVEKWIRLFNEGYPGAPVIGGLASGLAIGRPSWMLLGGEAFTEGAVGVALSGEVDFEIVVAQGCRPIGSPLIVTKAEGHVLYELGGKAPLEVLRGVIRELSPADQELARQSLFVGVAMNEYKDHLSRGDFLIRNLMGYDAETGALMIGTVLHPGQTLQFQLRDAKTSDEDLKALLERIHGAESGTRGALLVSCCGRGRGLYGEADHDSKIIQSMKGPLPLAGFFANGEIGPVGACNYVHGYTSSLAVIR